MSEEDGNVIEGPFKVIDGGAGKHGNITIKTDGYPCECTGTISPSTMLTEIAQYDDVVMAMVVTYRTDGRIIVHNNMHDDRMGEAVLKKGLEIIQEYEEDRAKDFLTGREWWDVEAYDGSNSSMPPPLDVAPAINEYEQEQDGDEYDE